MCPSPASRPDVGSRPTQPAPGQIDLGPGVQVGEVGCGARRAVERLHVGRELNQVARDEPRRQPEVPQRSAPAASRSRGTSRCRASSVSSRRLHARLQADDVADRRCDSRRLRSTRKSIGPRAARGRSLATKLAQLRAGRQPTSRNGASSLRSLGSYANGNCLGRRLEEEVERIDDRHLGDEIDLDRAARASVSGKTSRAR